MHAPKNAPVSLCRSVLRAGWAASTLGAGFLLATLVAAVARLGLTFEIWGWLGVLAGLLFYVLGLGWIVTHPASRQERLFLAVLHTTIVFGGLYVYFWLTGFVWPISVLGFVYGTALLWALLVVLWASSRPWCVFATDALAEKLLPSKDPRVAWDLACSKAPTAYFSEFKTLSSDGAFRACAELGVPIYHLWVAHEALLGRIPVRWLSERAALLLEPPAFYTRLKRALDVFLVLLSVPLTFPFGLLIALLIKLDSPGPVLFVQTRVGQDGRPFLIYKFRTMRVEANGEAAKFATEEGDRVTRIGRILRKFRIDEVPQFINVLKGEMSLIGPRPEQEAFAKKFSETIPFYPYRHRVRPGITGWAQVMQGYAASEEETRAKLEFDLFYVKNLSFSLDYLIFLKTIKTILTGFGAR